MFCGPESLAAVLTMMGPLPGMEAHVRCQLVIIVEALTAHMAEEPQLCTQLVAPVETVVMGFKAAFLRKALSTLIATERFCTQLVLPVDAVGMELEAAFRSKAFPALVATERFLSCVHPHVTLQTLFLWELFATYFAGMNVYAVAHFVHYEVVMLSKYL